METPSTATATDSSTSSPAVDSANATSATDAAASSTSGWGGWLGSFVSQSLQTVTTDLQEFVTVIKTDTGKQTEELSQELEKEIKNFSVKINEVKNTVASGNLVNSLVSGAATGGGAGSGSGGYLDRTSSLNSLHSLDNNATTPSSTAVTPSMLKANSSTALSDLDPAGNGGGVSDWMSAVTKDLGSKLGFLSSTDANTSPAKSSSSTRVFARNTAMLVDLQQNVKTYTTEPEEKEEFEKYCATFKLSDKTETISKLLSSSTELRTLHNKLVPAVITHDVFWQRYFFRVMLLELEDSRRKAMLTNVYDEEEEIINWDDDETDVKTTMLEDKNEHDGPSGGTEMDAEVVTGASTSSTTTTNTGSSSPFEVIKKEDDDELERELADIPSDVEASIDDDEFDWD